MRSSYDVVVKSTSVSFLKTVLYCFVFIVILNFRQFESVHTNAVPDKILNIKTLVVVTKKNYNFNM